MERIQRALEISRLQRLSLPEMPGGPEIPAEPRPKRAPTASPPEGSARTFTIDPVALHSRRVVLPDDVGVAARAYRMLRAQVLQRLRDGGKRVFGVVSAVPGEGKTLTAVNLAMSLAAEPNQQVALVDLDLRHPSVANLLGITPDWGLETWLRAVPVANPTCRIEGVPRLCVVPTVTPVVGSSDVIAGQRTRDLFEALKSEDHNGVLIVDLPPALLSDDVLTAAPLLDGYILVISEGLTRRDDVERVYELLGRSRIIGTVLNGSKDSEQRTY